MNRIQLLSESLTDVRTRLDASSDGLEVKARKVALFQQLSKCSKFSLMSPFQIKRHS